MSDIPVNENKQKLGVSVFATIKEIILIAALLGVLIFFVDIKVELGELQVKFKNVEIAIEELNRLHPRIQGGERP